LHGTSIAYEGGSMKLEGGSTTPSVITCRVHAPVAWNLLGLLPNGLYWHGFDLESET
jgi:hypothetical protein